MLAKQQAQGRRSVRRGRLLLAAGAALAACAVPAVATASTWDTGDVFAGVSSGNYNVYSNSGTFKETVSIGGDSFTTGCAFDRDFDLWTTDFGGSRIVELSGSHPHGILTPIDVTDHGGGQPEALAFDSSGNIYSTNRSGDGDVKKYDASGNFLDTYDVEGGVSDWLDLSSDEQTVFYGTEGRDVYRYDTASDTQLSEFATFADSGNVFAMRLLPPGDGSGGLLVADRNEIKRLDGAGNVVQTYDVAGQDAWLSLNLDPNGTSFWSGDFNSGDFYRFNIFERSCRGWPGGHGRRQHPVRPLPQG